MGEKSAANLIAGIAASRSRDLWRMLSGLGIPHVGTGVAKILGRRYATLDDVMNANRDELTSVEDIGEVIAESVAAWFSDPANRRLVERLRDAGLNFHSALYQPAEAT